MTQTKTRTIIGPTGVATQVEVPVTTEEIEEQASNSAAAAELEALRAGRGAIIEKHFICGKDRFIRRMNWPQHTRYGILVDKVLERNGGDMLHAITVALLVSAVATSDAKDAPNYFTQAEAEAYVEEPTARELVKALFDIATTLNPAALPPKKKGKPKGRPLKWTSKAGS